jgi:hypothetical protein
VHFDDPVTVTCLVANAETALADQQAAVALLREWMRFKKLDYYRIACPDCNGTRRMFFYEVSESEGVYWARDRGEDPVDLEGPIVPQSADWDAPLSKLRFLAEQVDAEGVLLVPEAVIVSADLRK